MQLKLQDFQVNPNELWGKVGRTCNFPLGMYLACMYHVCLATHLGEYGTVLYSFCRGGSCNAEAT